MNQDSVILAVMICELPKLLEIADRQSASIILFDIYSVAFKVGQPFLDLLSLLCSQLFDYFFVGLRGYGKV